MKLAILFILLTFQTQGQNLEWNDAKKLAFDDFKGTPDPSRPKQYLGLALGLEVHLKRSQVQGLKKFNSQVTSLFSPGGSWIAEGNKTSLRYANLLFDLNEWMAREVRKRLNQNKSKVLDGRGESVYEDVKTEFDTYIRTVGAETEGGENQTGMMAWETKIQERLISLADYCKKCN